ncbi:Uncharacterized protein APZ42_033454 [Daphnia magna]|uniref:CCHC-type domain-containing protein n=1 Tax=Daphnia magna TaxID=35525 RepID=A0A164L2W2_9CRUS|nr:Uncharacterized protein APZ42_033454 [Daphnia magna]
MTTRPPEDERVHFKQWTAHNDNLRSSTAHSVDLNRNTRSVFHLPKLDLKPYDGDPKKWLDLIAIFRDLVHPDSSLSATEKMALLKRSLSEEIRNGLGDSLSSSALYSEALTEIDSTYGYPQILSRAYIQYLIELPKVNNNDYKTLIKFSQTLNGAVSSLKNEDFSNWIHVIVKGEMMVQHCLVSTASSSPPNKSILKPGRQQTDQKTKHSPTINIIGKKASAVVSTAVKHHDVNKTLTCLQCRGEHRLSSCTSFTSLSLEERIKIIKDYNCCLRCLTKGHWTKDCFNKTKCNIQECTAHHHPLLYGAPNLSVSFKNEGKALKERKSEASENKNTTKKGVGTHTVEGDSTTTLLLTVPVIIEANGVHVKTVGILDQGSQASLILDKI